MPHVAVSALGADRPGIVAAVTGVLYEKGCNLEDTDGLIMCPMMAEKLTDIESDNLRSEGRFEARAGDSEALSPGCRP